jgi:hypothetical protein
MPLRHVHGRAGLVVVQALPARHVRFVGRAGPVHPLRCWVLCQRDGHGPMPGMPSQLVLGPGVVLVQAVRPRDLVAAAGGSAVVHAVSQGLVLRRKRNRGMHGLRIGDVHPRGIVAQGRPVRPSGLEISRRRRGGRVPCWHLHLQLDPLHAVLQGHSLQRAGCPGRLHVRGLQPWVRCPRVRDSYVRLVPSRAVQPAPQV